MAFDFKKEYKEFYIFVLPEYHGQGIGRKIIDTLEKD